jgi:plasmid stability protein
MTKIPQPTPFPLRMPDELRARVEVLAKTNGRSTNAEIVAVLDATTGGAPLSAVPVEDLLKAVAQRLGATVQIHVMAEPVVPVKTGARQSK